MGLKDKDGSVQTDQHGILDFHRAASQGDLQAVKRFVNNGGNVDAKFRFGTALHLAASVGRVDVVQYLVESGAALDAKDKRGTTALHIAALAGDVDVVQYLVECGATVDAKNKNEKMQESSDNFVEKRSESEHADGASKDEENESLRQNKRISRAAPETSCLLHCPGNKERPIELRGFRNCYADCPVSCVSSVVSFIFFVMGLPVCIRRFEREVQNTLNVINKECKEEFEVGNCSLALIDFHGAYILEEKSKISEVITDVDKIGHHLEKATESMKGEQHPALFIMHYNTGRTGHCLAIMPDLKFIDVQKECYWHPEKDPHWKRLSKIEVWRIEKEVAEEFEKKCGVKRCKEECKAHA